MFESVPLDGEALLEIRRIIGSADEADHGAFGDLGDAKAVGRRLAVADAIVERAVQRIASKGPLDLLLCKHSLGSPAPRKGCAASVRKSGLADAFSAITFSHASAIN